MCRETIEDGTGVHDTWFYVLLRQQQYRASDDLFASCRHAKGFLLGAQFEALLQDGLYWDLARHANALALRLRDGMAALEIPFPVPSPSNQQFPVLPNGGAGTVLMDSGANVECTAEYLLQFAYMGSFYAKRMMGLENPRVGLANVGTEDTKGGPLQHEAFRLLKEAGEAGRINFIGNVEGNSVFAGDVDVIVTDGFTGNMMLKTSESMIKFILGNLKDVFYKSLKNKLAAAVLKGDLEHMKRTLDVKEVGGTVMLGISAPVIKAHGSSDARCILAAARQAKTCVESGIIEDIKANIEYMKIG